LSSLQITKQNQRISTATSRYNRNSKFEDIGCYEEILETADTIEGNSVLKAELCNRKVWLRLFCG
jgi:hypothetical protein